jgi:hypothetical protein
VDLYLKYEGMNPTGSFKDRGMTMAVSKAKEAGAKMVICASTGNTSASAAAYAARAGIECVVLIPKGAVALGKLSQALIHNAKVIAIDGNFDKALHMVRDIAAKEPAMTLVNSVNPYRLEGQKTGAFEICDQFDGKAPEFHAIPVGNAGNITAYWKGYKEYFQKGLSPDVEKSVRDAVKKLESLGAAVQEVSLPHTKYAVSVYYIVAPSETSSNLARFDGIRYGFRDKDAKSLHEVYEKSRGEGFGAEAKRRIILGTFSLSSGYYDAYYLRAMKVRTKIKNDFDEAFKKVDIIATPTAPSVAFKIGEKSSNPLEMYLSDIYTISVNLAGLPAISIPCGKAKPANGAALLPIGLQLIGKPFDEPGILKMAYAYEQAAK